MAKFSSHNKNDYSPRISTKIYALRRDGLLDDARQLAEDYLQKNRTDIDVLKAYAWTLIDICKRGATERKYCRCAKNFSSSVAYALRDPIR